MTLYELMVPLRLLPLPRAAYLKQMRYSRLRWLFFKAAQASFQITPYCHSNSFCDLFSALHTVMVPLLQLCQRTCERLTETG